ncbi:hypothetical protein GCM10023155_46870 [Bremerella cremea]
MGPPNKEVCIVPDFAGACKHLASFFQRNGLKVERRESVVFLAFVLEMGYSHLRLAPGNPLS